MVAVSRTPTTVAGVSCEGRYPGPIANDTKSDQLRLQPVILHVMGVRSGKPCFAFYSYAATREGRGAPIDMNDTYLGTGLTSLYNGAICTWTAIG
jgi:hypothetical protein